MSSVRTAPAYPALVIDGSSSCFFAGALVSDGTWLSQELSPEPALESLFKTTDAILQTASLELDAIRSFIYCEGPGSVLGLRLCAMAIETWARIQTIRPQLFAYNSLELLAAQLIQDGRISEDSLLISDWKKDTWNGLRLNKTGFDSVRAVPSRELADWAGPLYHLPARKGWQQAPENATTLDYQPEVIARLIKATPEVTKQTESITLFQSGLNS
ncbi:MAG: hypothetical protein ACPGSB_00345, partial [Opitutales bacterium]